MSADFFIVPSQNLPTPIPQKVADFVVSLEDLKREYRVPEDTDLAGSILVDSGCPREVLGTGVKHTFEQSVEHTLTDAASASGARGNDGEPDSPASAADELSPNPAATPAPEKTKGPASESSTAAAKAAPKPAPALKTAATTAPASSAVEGARKPAPASSAVEGAQKDDEVVVLQTSKRARVLKMMHSEEHERPEETEANSWEELLNKIKKAARAKSYYSADGAASTVHFWSKQVVGAMRSGKSSSQMHERFPGFLLRILYTGETYSALKNFVSVFEDLHKLGCSPPVSVARLKGFAEANAGALEPIEWAKYGDGDLGARVKFFGSPLYRDFWGTRVRSLLQVAQGTEEKDTLQKALEALSPADLGDTHPELAKQVAWAVSLMSPQIPVETRLTFALGESAPDRIRFAATFKVLLTVADVNWQAALCLADCVEVPASVSFEAICETMALALRAGLRKVIED